MSKSTSYLMQFVFFKHHTLAFVQYLCKQRARGIVFCLLLYAITMNATFGLVCAGALLAYLE